MPPLRSRIRRQGYPLSPLCLLYQTMKPGFQSPRLTSFCGADVSLWRRAPPVSLRRLLRTAYGRRLSGWFQRPAAPQRQGPRLMPPLRSRVRRQGPVRLSPPGRLRPRPPAWAGKAFLTHWLFLLRLPAQRLGRRPRIRRRCWTLPSWNGVPGRGHAAGKGKRRTGTGQNTRQAAKSPLGLVLRNPPALRPQGRHRPGRRPALPREPPPAPPSAPQHRRRPEGADVRRRGQSAPEAPALWQSRRESPPE